MELVVHLAEVDATGTRLRLSTEVIDSKGKGKNILHIMPVDAVEWRVAQFNITPEEALDVLVSEPYMTETDQETLDLLPTRTQARSRVLQRKADALSKITYKSGPAPEGLTGLPDSLATSGSENPKALLLAQSVLDDNEIVLKRAVMDVQRELVRERAAQPAQKPTARARRAPAAARLAVAPQQSVEIVEQPSSLAERLIAKRLEQVRTRRNGPKS
jgi:hypothetical protein